MASTSSQGLSKEDQRRQEIVDGVKPILEHLPPWVETCHYEEFEDNEIPICDSCKVVCQHTYFKLISTEPGLEMCAKCLEKKKLQGSITWKLFIRKGLIPFLSSLNAELVKARSSVER